MCVQTDLEGAVNAWAGNVLDDDGHNDGHLPEPKDSFNHLSEAHDLCLGQPSDCFLLELPPGLLLNSIGMLLDSADLGALGGTCSSLRVLAHRGFEARALRLLAADKSGWLADSELCCAAASSSPMRFMQVPASFFGGVFPRDDVGETNDFSRTRAGCFRMLDQLLSGVWDAPAPSLNLRADAQAMRKAILSARKQQQQIEPAPTEQKPGDASNTDLLAEHYATLALPPELLASQAPYNSLLLDQPAADRWAPSAALLAVERIGRWAALGGHPVHLDRYDLPSKIEPSKAELYAASKVSPGLAARAGLLRCLAQAEVKIEYALVAYNENVTAVARATEQAADLYGQLHDHCVDSCGFGTEARQGIGLGWLCRKLRKQSELFRWLAESGPLGDITAAETRAEGLALCCDNQNKGDSSTDDEHPLIGLRHPATRQARVMRGRTLSDMAETISVAAETVVCDGPSFSSPIKAKPSTDWRHALPAAAADGLRLQQLPGNCRLAVDCEQLNLDWRRSLPAAGNAKNDKNGTSRLQPLPRAPRDVAQNRIMSSTLKVGAKMARCAAELLMRLAERELLQPLGLIGKAIEAAEPADLTEPAAINSSEFEAPVEEHQGPEMTPGTELAEEAAEVLSELAELYRRWESMADFDNSITAHNILASWAEKAADQMDDAVNNQGAGLSSCSLTSSFSLPVVDTTSNHDSVDDEEADMKALQLLSERCEQRCEEVWNLHRARYLKDSGNRAFSAKLLDIAVEHYQAALALCDRSGDDPMIDQQERQVIDRLERDLLLNCAAVMLEQRRPAAAELCCDAALAIDPKCAKGYYRRSLARQAQLRDASPIGRPSKERERLLRKQARAHAKMVADLEMAQKLTKGKNKAIVLALAAAQEQKWHDER
eukprot:SAG31_NODE_142_length_22669_cov_18.630040_4_plen_889_part_00